MNYNDILGRHFTISQLKDKQKEILDSIRYAKRIQITLLTSEHYITRQLKRLKL